MRQKLKFTGKRSVALAMCGAMGLSFLAGGVATAVGGRKIALAADTANTISINTGMQYQTLDGWGSTLAWWANEIGDWTKPSAVGTTQREYIMELLYGKDGLDWNIARYNIGGGDDPTHTHMPDSRNMPGFRGATKDEDGNFIPDELYCYEDESGITKSWEETTDYNQLWVLNWIQQHRDDTMTEFFSNSPPYWMTISGCASGSTSTAKPNPNMPNEMLDDYVEYFLDVYEYLVSQGFTFDYLQPFNESTSGQWHGLTGSQEGCDFTVEQKIDVLALMQDEVKKRGYDIGYNFSDEVDSTKEVEVFSQVYNSNHVAPNGMTGKDVINNADKYTYHIYGYNNGSTTWMRRMANLLGKEIEMSEICWSEGSKHDVEDMTTAFKYSTSIIDILKYGGAQSYIFWQGVEDKVGQINGATNYGLLQGVYYTADEAMEKGVDISSLGLTYQDVTTSKAYYVTGQYSKYMKKGYSIIECLGDRSLAAVSPNGDQVVIVKENNSGDPKEITFNLDGFNATGVTKITTDATRNWAKEYPSASGTTFKDTVTANSVTTYVIDGIQTKGKSHFIDNTDLQTKGGVSSITTSYDSKGNFSGAEVNLGSLYSMKEINALLLEDPEVEALYMNYANNDSAGVSNSSSAKNYLYGGTYYTNDPKNYAVLRFKGTGFSIAALQKNDAGTINIWIDPETENYVPSSPATDEANLKQQTQVNRKEVYRNNTLEDGWHTVYIAPKSGWFNFDGCFVFSEKDKTADAIVAPVLTDAAASKKDGKIYASFTKDEALTNDGYSYYMEYRRAGGDWIRSNAAATEANGAFTITETPSFNAELYDVRVVAVNGNDLRASSSKIVYMNNYYANGNGLLYYVDCGTSDFSNNYAGRILGVYNSVYNKAYGTDLATGKAWGYVGKTANSSYYAANDPLMSIDSGDYYTDGVITYKFTIPTAGNYRLTLGTYNEWDLRYADVALTSAAGTLATATHVKSEKSAYVEVLEFTTTTDNEEITFTMTKADGSDNPTLSLIVITDTATAIPLYADAVSNYAEGVKSAMATLTIGTNMMEGGLQSAQIKVTMSDGTEESHTVADNNLIFKSATLDSVTNGSAIYATYELTFDGMGNMVAQKSFQAAQSGKTTYYNIDTGSDGSNAGAPGTLQGSSPDQEDDGSTWGYFNGEGANWTNEAIDSSIRQFPTNGNGGYNLRGFGNNENLTVTIGSNVHDWGNRTTTVKFNNSNASPTLQPKQNGGNVEQVYSTQADASGTLKINFVGTSGGQPQISYVRVESVPTGGGNLITAVPQAMQADKTSYTPSDSEKIVLTHVAEGATIYVLDSEDNFVDCFTAEGTATATPAYGVTVEWKNWDKLGEYAESVRFCQAYDGNAQASAELKVSLTVKPELEIKFDRDALEDGSIITLRFTPKFPTGSQRSVTAFSLRLPEEYGIKNEDGSVTCVEVNLIDSFFFRTVYNGTYTAIMKVDGVTFEYPFTVDVVDTITLDVDKNEAATSDPVKVTLTPNSTKGVAGITVNGEQKTLENGKYEFTATENGNYEVVVISNSGFKKTFTVSVDNIEPATPSLTLNISYDFASGLKVNYTTNAAGGTLYVSINGKQATAVEEGVDLLASDDGKYVFYYENGLGVKSAEKTYYVTHNPNEAKLGTVKINNGSVSVSGANATLYRAGSSTPLSEMNVKENGKYYLELNSDKGTELVVLNTTAGLNINWEGVSHVADIAMTIVFSLIAAGLVVGIVVLVLGKRRKS